jgi:hypothetical protein
MVKKPDTPLEVPEDKRTDPLPRELEEVKTF